MIAEQRETLEVIVVIISRISVGGYFSIPYKGMKKNLVIESKGYSFFFFISSIFVSISRGERTDFLFERDLAFRERRGEEENVGEKKDCWWKWRRNSGKEGESDERESDERESDEQESDEQEEKGLMKEWEKIIFLLNEKRDFFLQKWIEFSYF